ncbi:MAG: adenylate/guanylate cyclase domain-containing protein, partial [Candidatus Rifleibacteriota bacterium]
ISAWTSLLQDFENYRISQLQKELYMSALNIEAGLAKVDSIFFNASKATVKKPEFTEQIFALPEKPEIEDEFFASVYESYKKHGVELSAITVLIQGGWYFTSSYRKDVTGHEAAMINNAVASIMHQFLYDADRQLYEKFKIPSEHIDKKIPTILDLSDLDVEDNIYSLRRMFDRCSNFNTENGNYLQYLHQVDIDNRPFAVIMAYWNWVPRAEKRFKLLLNSESIRFKNSWGLVPDFAVFKRTRQGVQKVVSSGNLRGLSEMAEYPVNKITNFKDKNYASVMLPSSRLPDYRYVARASNIDILMQVEKEKALISVSICALMLIIGLGASAASWWVIGPVNNLSLSLKQLEQGRKPFIKELRREDELGIAASSLRRMTGWILQREKLVRFISPKVLEIVADGNPFKAGAGSLQEVTVLVSDIRSFTTLSEEQPPEEVFRMLNFHLARMSEKIIAHSGAIDRYVGDAIWAVFYDKHPAGGEQALKAAIEMMKIHRFIQDQRLKQGKFAYGIGIGLVKGRVLAGVMGEASVRLDFTIVGEALNRAENLEALSKNGKKTGIVFGPELVECAQNQNITFEPLASHKDVLEVANLE